MPLEVVPERAQTKEEKVIADYVGNLIAENEFLKDLVFRIWCESITPQDALAEFQQFKRVHPDPDQGAA